MEILGILNKRVIVIAAAVFGVLLIGAAFAFEPVTRNLVSTDALCIYCHLEVEYDPAARMTMSKVHPAKPEGGQARCVDCHLPEGFFFSLYAYSHYASATDLYGHFRDRDGERAGAWIPQSAARAYRMRDRLFEYDSNTCRTCHIEAEIKPKRPRGQQAHAEALKNKETCIECHGNLAHRYVAFRKGAFKKPEKAGN